MSTRSQTWHRVVAITIAAALPPLSAVAQRPGPGHGHGPGHGPVHGPAPGGPVGGAPGWHGGGVPGWQNGWNWWTFGLGLGLGWQSAYGANPYYYPYYYPAPPVVVVPSAPPPPAVWYYCDPAGDYYPRVTVCPVPWRVVPATPQPP